LPALLLSRCRTGCREKARKSGDVSPSDNQNNRELKEKVKNILNRQTENVLRSFEARCRTSLPTLSCLAFSLMEELPMAKRKTEIHVTTVYDGKMDATDVFVGLIAQKYGLRNSGEYLVKKQDSEYNEDEVQKDRVPSGLCG
jgi:D-aminopeptidase